jgi:DNA-binding MltR family transcriptional regulator
MRLFRSLCDILVTNREPQAPAAIYHRALGAVRCGRFGFLVTESKSLRKAALRNLAALNKGRDANSVSIGVLYPYGLYAEKARNPAYDRDIAITTVTIVEQGLENAILHEMKLRAEADDILFTGQAPIIRDLADKIKLAYLLGVIGPLTMADLGSIRAIRNAFAHSREYLDFDVPELLAVLETITYSDRWPQMMDGAVVKDQREQFIQTCFQLAMYLHLYPPKETLSRVMHERVATIRQ